ncbi:MAG: hypothetical protein WAM21_18430 [Steroidobacteraceae bacterium]
MRVSAIVRDRLLGCLPLILLCGDPAAAQTATTPAATSTEPALQEVVVTANRREEQLGRVPVSV